MISFIHTKQLFLIPLILLLLPCCVKATDKELVLKNSKESLYVLPYPVGKTYTCIQGYIGRTYHRSVFTYGVDFAMPIGTIVTAARSGRVLHTEERFFDGDYGLGKENLVVILHEDGTYGRYIHLTHNGALVDIGQSVKQGEPIGLSGNTGLSDVGPHLHFDVTQECPNADCQTIPVCFRNTTSNPYGLETGVEYTAEPFTSK